jgi:hypothetical protein
MTNTKHILHHLRRNRSYNRQEKWGVFAALGIMTVIISATSFLWDGKPAVSSIPYGVEKVEAPTEVQLSDAKPAEAIITVMDRDTGLPATNLWVGLLITDKKDRAPEYTYHEWYSPISARAFFPTDTKGQVIFPLKAKEAGVVEYQIFSANPESQGNDKYTSLTEKFTVTYW